MFSFLNNSKADRKSFYDLSINSIDGNEIKLGNRVQFRSGGDIYYRFKNNVRVGVGFYHISNAGLGEQNPGAEQAILKYQIPF